MSEVSYLEEVKDCDEIEYVSENVEDEYDYDE